MKVTIWRILGIIFILICMRWICEREDPDIYLAKLKLRDLEAWFDMVEKYHSQLPEYNPETFKAYRERVIAEKMKEPYDDLHGFFPFH